MGMQVNGIVVAVSSAGSKVSGVEGRVRSSGKFQSEGNSKITAFDVGGNFALGQKVVAHMNDRGLIISLDPLE